MFATATPLGIALRNRGLHYTSCTLLEFLSTGDLRGERRTFKWFLKRAESETPCKLILVVINLNVIHVSTDGKIELYLLVDRENFIGSSKHQ